MEHFHSKLRRGSHFQDETIAGKVKTLHRKMKSVFRHILGIYLVYIFFSNRYKTHIRRDYFSSDSF